MRKLAQLFRSTAFILHVMVANLDMVGLLNAGKIISKGENGENGKTNDGGKENKRQQ